MSISDRIVPPAEREARLQTELNALDKRGYTVARVVGAGTVVRNQGGETLIVAVDQFGALSVRAGDAEFARPLTILERLWKRIFG